MPTVRQPFAVGGRVFVVGQEVDSDDDVLTGRSHLFVVEDDAPRVLERDEKPAPKKRAAKKKAAAKSDD